VLDVPGGLQPGDFDLDGNVTMADFVILSDNFGTGTTLAQGDANQDGRVGLDDFQIFAANFTPAGAPLAGVPEPGGLALLGLASVLLLSFTRGRRS
jgi:hypothetical protein